MALGERELFPAPDGVEKALYPAIVAALREILAAAHFREHVVDAGLALRRAELGELVQRVRPVVQVDEIEIGVARMIGDCTPVFRILHAVDDRAVAARRLAEAASVLARGQRAELAVDERNELAGEVIRVIPDGGRIDVLIAAERGEAIGEHEDRGSHLALVDQSGSPFRDVFAEGLPADMREPRAREADKVEQDGKAPAPALVRALVVVRRQPDGELAHMGIAKRIIGQDPGGVLADDDAAGGGNGTLLGHGAWLLLIVVEKSGPIASAASTSCRGNGARRNDTRTPRAPSCRACRRPRAGSRR